MHLKLLALTSIIVIFSALIKLLHDCAESAPSKYEELVMKCLWKIVRIIHNWAADLDYDAILLEVHRFLKVCLLFYTVSRIIFNKYNIHELVLRRITQACGGRNENPTFHCERLRQFFTV